MVNPENNLLEQASLRVKELSYWNFFILLFTSVSDGMLLSDNFFITTQAPNDSLSDPLDQILESYFLPFHHH